MIRSTVSRTSGSSAATEGSGMGPPALRSILRSMGGLYGEGPGDSGSAGGRAGSMRRASQGGLLKTLYRASRVHTFGPQPMGEWILVDERHVERVGSGDPPPADRVVDLPGTTVIPGFVDAHVHLSGTGMSQDGPNFSAVGSREALL